MTKENFFNNFVSSTYSFFSVGTSTIFGSIQSLTQSLWEIQLWETKYEERIADISSIIEIQQSEVEYLEKHVRKDQNGIIEKEIGKIKADLKKLVQQKDALQKKLGELKEIEDGFDPETNGDPIKEFKVELKQLAAQNKLDKGIEQLMNGLAEDSNAYDELILFSAKLKSIDKQKSLGLLSNMEHNSLHSNVIYGFLQLVNELEASDIVLL